MASSTLSTDPRWPQRNLSRGPRLARAKAKAKARTQKIRRSGLLLATTLAFSLSTAAQARAHTSASSGHATRDARNNTKITSQPANSRPATPQPANPTSPTPTRTQGTATPPTNPPPAATSPRPANNPNNPQTTAPANPRPAPTGSPNAPQQPPSSTTIPPNLTGPSQTNPNAGPTTGPTTAAAGSPNRPAGPSSQAEVSDNELQDRYYDQLYRPAHNPIRPLFILRGGIALGGNSSRSDGGRGGLIELEGGASINWLDLSLAFGAQMGRYKKVPGRRIPNPKDPTAPLRLGSAHPTPVTLSLGPRVSWGRMALFGSGFIAPRLGYDFHWTAVQKVGGQRPFKSAITHGPTLRVDVGFVSRSNRQTQLRRVFGATLGWNMVAGSIKNKLPRQHFLLIGLFFNMN